MKKTVPSFKDSPAHAWFGHLVPDDGIVEAKDVKINWNHVNIGENEGLMFCPFRVKDVAIIFHPKRLIKAKGHPIFNWADDLDDRYFRYTHGNIFTDWEDNDLAVATLKIWDDLCDYGFQNDAEAERARIEFARIRECPWARDKDFETPKGVPWTDADQDALIATRKQKKESEKQEEERKRNPPPPPFVVHTSDYGGVNHIFENRECAVEHFTESLKRYKARLDEFNGGKIVIDRENPKSHRPIPEFEASMWDDKMLMRQIKAWCSTDIGIATTALKKIEAGQVNEDLPGLNSLHTLWC